MDKEIIKEYHSIIKNKISQSRIESAMGNIEKLLLNFPNDEYGYYYKGVCEFALNNHKEAIKAYLKAIQLNPAFAKAYFNLGACYYDYNDYDNALINIAKAMILFSKLKQLDLKERCVKTIKLIEAERQRKC